MISLKNKKSGFLYSLLNKFYCDKRGVVAIIFGISIIPILLAVGLSVDYSVTSDNKAKLDGAADAAALAGAIKAKSYIANNQGKGLPDSVIISQAITIAEIEAGKVFDAAASQLVRTHNVTRTPKVNVYPANRSVTSNVTYGADVNLAFGPLVHINDFHVLNTVDAQSTLPTYLDIYVVLDNSGSMGIGADDTNILKVRSQLGGCDIACHALGDASYNNIKNFNLIAPTLADKIVLRIDVLRNAISDMLIQANSLKTTNDLFQFSLFSFSNDLVVLKTLSTDYSALNTAVSTLDLDSLNGGTNFHYSIGNKLTGILPNTQDGSSALKRKTHVVIVTDGVENNRFVYGSVSDPNFVPWYGNGTPRNDGGPLSDGDELQAFDPAICDGLKAKGAQVTVLNVKYIVPVNAIVGADEFSYVATNILGHEATTIAGCASSPSNYYSANTPSEIKAAVESIFNGILKPTRLTH